MALLATTLVLLQRIWMIDGFVRYYVPASSPSDFTLSQMAIKTAEQMSLRPQGFVLPLTSYRAAPAGLLASNIQPIPAAVNPLYYSIPDYRNPGLLPFLQQQNTLTYPMMRYHSLASLPQIVEAPSLPAGMVPVSPIGSNGNSPIFGPMPVNQLAMTQKVPIEQPIPYFDVNSNQPSPSYFFPGFPSQQVVQLANNSSSSGGNSPISGQMPVNQPPITQKVQPFEQPMPYFRVDDNRLSPNYLLPGNSAQLGENSIPIGQTSPAMTSLLPISASYPVVVDPRRDETSSTTTTTTMSTTKNPRWQYSTLPQFTTTTTTTTPTIYSLQTTQNPMGFLAAVHSAIGQFQDSTTQPPMKRFTFTFKPTTSTGRPTTIAEMTTFPLRLNLNPPPQTLQSEMQNFRFNLTRFPSMAGTSTRSPPILLKAEPINRALEKLFMKKYNVGEKWRPSPIQPSLFQTRAPQSHGPVRIGSKWADRLQGRPFVFPNQFNFLNTPVRPQFHVEFPEYENPQHKSMGLGN